VVRRELAGAHAATRRSAGYGVAPACITGPAEYRSRPVFVTKTRLHLFLRILKPSLRLPVRLLLFMTAYSIACLVQARNGFPMVYGGLVNHMPSIPCPPTSPGALSA
jgi:hypothetical protein